MTQTQHPPEGFDVDTQLSRRRFLGVAAGALGATSLLAACGGTDSDGGGEEAPAQAGTALEGIEQFTIANWGGITSDAMLNSWGKLFTENTSIPVQAVTIDYGKFVAQIESDEVEWDWADVEGWFPIAQADLLEDLDYEAIGVTEGDMVDPSLFTPKAVGSYLNSYVIAYRTDKEDQRHPTSWQEFFDTSAIPGKRSLYNWPYGIIEIALLADGVPFNQLYPLDVDRALQKIDSVRKDIVFWNTGAEAQQFLVSGAVDFIVPWSSRVSYLALGGLPIGVEWSENLRIADFHIIPQHNPRAAACTEFIKAALDPQAQAEFAVKAGGLAPTTKKGFDLVDENVKPYLNTQPENWDKAVGNIDDSWWAENLTAVSTKWFEFVGG